MSKNSRILGSLLVLLLLIGSLSFPLSSCTEPPTPAELHYLDTLHYRLKGNEQALNLDPEKLSQRKKVVQEEFIPAIQDTFPEIRKRYLDDFQGIITTYELFMSKQLLLNSSTEILRKELEDLRAETDKQAVSRQEFKSRYADLRARVEKNTQAIRQVAKPVYDLEPMWMRFDRMFGAE